MALAGDPLRPGLISADRTVRATSREIDVEESTPSTEVFSELQKQTKQLKYLRAHLEIMTNEEIDLSTGDDDDAAGI